MRQLVAVWLLPLLMERDCVAASSEAPTWDTIVMMLRGVAAYLISALFVVGCSGADPTSDA
ncbi:MAG: hypothetical protein ACXVGO_02380, partial [Mycobacterium sp.]